MKPKIAIVDDEARMVSVLSMVFGREGYEVQGHGSAASLLESFERDPPDLVLTDLRMPGLDGLGLLAELKARDASVPVILMTAHADVPTAIGAMKRGAHDYVQKPFDNDELKALVSRALEVTRLDRENRYLRSELEGAHPAGWVAESPSMQEALGLARRAAKSRSTVLVTGESGTGKELVARAVHYHSDRVAGPFVAVNLKALAEGVLESELFGHEKGAFTGADRARPGYFERASGGTLFLDEIGEIGPSVQAKLLRVLQERRFERVGGQEVITADVRFVAATNRDLQAEVAAGRFREDLYFRLAVIPIRLKPLRERPEDVLPLAKQFLARMAKEAGKKAALSAEADAALRAYGWPGNVRELENVIERAVVLGEGDVIHAKDLRLEGRKDEPREETLSETLDRAAAERIRAVLAECGGVRLDAARRLGIERTTLFRWMKKLGID